MKIIKFKNSIIFHSKIDNKIKKFNIFLGEVKEKDI